MSKATEAENDLLIFKLETESQLRRIGDVLGFMKKNNTEKARVDILRVKEEVLEMRLRWIEFDLATLDTSDLTREELRELYRSC